MQYYYKHQREPAAGGYYWHTERMYRAYDGIEQHYTGWCVEQFCGSGCNGDGQRCCVGYVGGNCEYYLPIIDRVQ